MTIQTADKDNHIVSSLLGQSEYAVHLLQDEDLAATGAVHLFVKVAYHKIYSGPMAIPIDPPVELPQVADTGNLFDNIP